MQAQCALQRCSALSTPLRACRDQLSHILLLQSKSRRTSEQDTPHSADTPLHVLSLTGSPRLGAQTPACPPAPAARGLLQQLQFRWTCKHPRTCRGPCFFPCSIRQLSAKIDFTFKCFCTAIVSGGVFRHVLRASISRQQYSVNADQQSADTACANVARHCCTTERSPRSPR